MAARQRQPAILGAVGFDGGITPAIAFVIPRRLASRQRRGSAGEPFTPSPCALLYGQDMELTLTGLTVNSIPCFDLGVDSVKWTSLTGINGAHTLAFVTDHWELTGVGSVGYTYYEDRTDCFDTGGNVTTGTVAVTFTAFCFVDGESAEFTVAVQTVPFTVGGNTVTERYVFLNGGNDGLGDTMTNIGSDCSTDGTGVLALA